MSRQTVAAPTPCCLVLFDATHLVTALGPYIVPAIVHRVVTSDTVALWAVDDDGVTLTVSVAGGLPVARFGEVSPGVPAPQCWCYPPSSDAQLVIGGSAPRIDIDRLVDPDQEPTFVP